MCHLRDDIFSFKVPTSVEMAEKRKYMMPVADGRYHLTIYFKDPNEICNKRHRGGRNSGKKVLIQTGASWKSTMNIPISETELESTAWVEGNSVPFMGKGDRINSIHSHPQVVLPHLI